jgi:hypothetical protein
MPQDTTIYWDGYDALPALIDSLPIDKKIEVLQVIEKRKEELSYTNPIWVYISLLLFILFFGGVAVYGKLRDKKKYPTLTKKVHSGVK